MGTLAPILTVKIFENSNLSRADETLAPSLLQRRPQYNWWPLGNGHQLHLNYHHGSYQANCP